jgi:predicted DNA-binding transcriptional regulator AlpA
MKKPRGIITNIRISFDIPIDQTERVLGFITAMNDGRELPIAPRRAGNEARRMLSINEVVEIVQLSRTTLFHMEKRGAFPQSHLLSPNRKIWYEDEVIKWINTRNKGLEPKAKKKRKAVKKRKGEAMMTGYKTQRQKPKDPKA